MQGGSKSARCRTLRSSPIILSSTFLQHASNYCVSSIVIFSSIDNRHSKDLACGDDGSQSLHPRPRDPTPCVKHLVRASCMLIRSGPDKRQFITGPGGYKFDVLQHLAGIAPYFDSPGVQLDPNPPAGCVVTKAAYMIRHSNIYANDVRFPSCYVWSWIEFDRYTSVRL